MNIKVKVNFFSINRLKFQPGKKKLKFCVCPIFTFLFNVKVNCSIITSY